ncbi:MAG: tyrosine-type recombinase/integrase [Nodularia sp. CChRGM 3473]
MDDDKWINVDPRTKKLSLRFRVRGFSRQFYISTGLNDTKRNREIVRSKRDAILNDIALERFDTTLKSYQFKPSGKDEDFVKVLPTQFNLDELWAKFLNFQSQHLEASTLESDYKAISKIIFDMPIKSFSDAAMMRDFLLKKYSYHTAWKCLAAFSRCCKWGINSGLIECNFFEKIQLPRLKKRSHESEIKAYTLEQRDLIIAAFENHPHLSHYSNLIKFLFWTGCRPGEAFALTWGDINTECTRISITKAYASRVRVVKGTKNDKRRVFTCNSDSRLRSLLLDIRPYPLSPEKLVFTSKSGQRLNLHALDKCWRGYGNTNSYHNGVVRELASNGIVPYLKVYSTRHTFATWAIASGASPEKVAYWIGDNINTVLTYYCHPDVTKTECPDF